MGSECLSNPRSSIPGGASANNTSLVLESTDQGLLSGLWASCNDIYLDYIYFQLPVLDVASLLRAKSEARPPWPAGSLLHHALVAAALPWLPRSLIAGLGHSTRDAAFDSRCSMFENCTDSRPDTDHLQQTQALLLMLFAASQTSTRALRAQEESWLRRAAANLNATPPQRQQSSLWKRVWWSAYVAEQLYYLRYTLEQGRLQSVRGSALHAQAAAPLTLDDMDIMPAGSPGGPVAAYWSRMQRASCFLQKKRLAQQMARLIDDLSSTSRGASLQALSGDGHLQHDETYWRIRLMAEQFGLYLEGVGGGGTEEEEENEEKRVGLRSLQLSVPLLVCRFVIALHRVLSKQSQAKRSAEGDSEDIWGKVRRNDIQSCVWRVVETAKQELRQANPAQRTYSDLFRALLVSATALRDSGATGPSQSHLREECQEYLRICLGLNEAFWTEHIPASEFVAGSGDGLSGHGIEGERERGVIPTPASNSEAGPGPASVNDLAEPGVSEGLEQESMLLSSFDDMWNKHMSVDGCDRSGVNGN